MFVHIPIAVGVQLACWLLGRMLGAPTKAAIWIGWFAGTAVCVMREITQHEYRWIEAYGHGRRANMPSYAGLQIWEWNAHSISETLVAAAAAAIIAMAVSYRRGS